jgi:hypothetical protein
VQRGILRAFILAPERTTRELMEWTHTLALYRGRRSRWRRHDYAKSIRRAADRIAVRVGRRWPDGIRMAGQGIAHQRAALWLSEAS